MIKNYFIVAIRYLNKHKGYSIINLLGLSVGIACCILIMMFVKSEWSYDKFHSKEERIFRPWLEEHYQGEVFTNTVTPIPLGPVLQENIPEIESMCRIAGLAPLVKYNNNTFTSSVNMVDSSFFNVFDFDLVQGQKLSAFQNANSVIVTESAAKKFFGSASPIGKNVEVYLNSDTVLFTITGIAKDLPVESSIQFEMLIPFSNAKYLWSEKTRTSAWSNVVLETYVLLKPGVPVAFVNTKIPSVLNPLVSKNYKSGEYNVHLQPLADIHLNNKLPAANQPISDPKYSYIMATLGLIVLLIACINFVTLSIGKSTSRALEVGVRKVLGAERSQLIKQFWGEAILITIMAMVIGIILAIALVNPFNQVTNRDLHLTFSFFTIIYCTLLLVIIALLAGIYPAIILSNFRPIQVLKGRLKVAGGLGLFRKGLIVGQFVSSIVMIIGAFAVGKQLQFMQSKDLGYAKEHVVIVPTKKSRALGNTLAARFKALASQNPKISATTTSLYSMAEAGWITFGYNDDKNAFRQFKFNAIDVDFIGAMGLKMVAGRPFEANNPSDSNYIIVNETLVKEYGWKDAIGKKLPGKYSQEVIGVVKDFNIQSLHTPITPVVMALKPDDVFKNSSDVVYNAPPQPRISIRFKGGDVKEDIAFLKVTWQKAAGDQEFEFKFLDDALNAAYEQEQRLGKIVQYASFLSIFIACIGLFGLVTLVVVKRTKEIGIRKILGADVKGIVTLIAKEFVVLIIIASLIAFPLAVFALNKWLQDFAYRIDIPWQIFLGAALIAMFIAIMTVSIQAIKAAWANPVKTLRTE